MAKAMRGGLTRLPASSASELSAKTLSRYSPHARKTATQAASTKSRVTKPQPSTRSILERNLNAPAISTKPRTTFTETIQPPALPCRELAHEGASASTKKGSENAREKANMPMAGYCHEPFAASAKTRPMNPTVQVKEMSVNVSPMNSTPMA